MHWRVVSLHHDPSLSFSLARKTRDECRSRAYLAYLKCDALKDELGCSSEASCDALYRSFSPMCSRIGRNGVREAPARDRLCYEDAGDEGNGYKAYSVWSK